MATTMWQRFYSARVGADISRVFDTLADLPQYPTWLPPSAEYRATTEVEPYPVRRGSIYHDGRPDEGKGWYGTVTGFVPPGSLDFHHVIELPRARASIDVRIHYSLEPGDADDPGDAGRIDATCTDVERWLLLQIHTPVPLPGLKRAVARRFDAENQRTMAALTTHLEVHR